MNMGEYALEALRAWLERQGDSREFVFCSVGKGGQPGADKAEVLKTIRAVAAGDVLFGPAVSNRVTDYFRSLQAMTAARARPTPPFPELTERELEVLELIARGHNNQEIAGALFVTVKTVSNHISNIFSKLQVADRAQAIVRAREAGLGRNGGLQ